MKRDQQDVDRVASDQDGRHATKKRDLEKAKTKIIQGKDPHAKGVIKIGRSVFDNYSTGFTMGQRTDNETGTDDD